MKVTELYDVKYAPFADSYIGMANGDTYEHAKRWLTQRFRFCDSLFDYAPSYNNDVLTIRANTTELMTLEIETYTPVYQHLSWYNNQMDKKKIDGKVATEFSGKAMAATDQEVLIYGGSNVKSIKGIQSMNPNRMLIGSATRLTELDASNCPLLNDINANKANLSPHTYLNKLNLENCPLLDGNLRLNASPLIREINIKGTNISGLNLPSSLRSLEVMKLPKTLTGFTLNDATSLHTLDFEEGTVLNDVSMTNCNALMNVTNFNLEDATNVMLNNSYDTINELYLSKTTNLSVSNMPNLEKVIYTPNAEHETFDITNLANTKDYNITTFNCPKLTTFMTTAPYRESYGKEYGDIKPNEVFEANSIDISNTQFTDVKLLCTTDTNVLKLPQTVKNLIVDSAYDLDTNYLTDGDYNTIHADLYEPYNTDYEGEVLINKYVAEPIIWHEGNFNTVYPSISWGNMYSDKMYIAEGSQYTIQLVDSNKPMIQWFKAFGFDSSDTVIWQHGGSTTTDTVACEGTIPSGVAYIRFSQLGNTDVTITYTKIYTPNLIPSASDGSIIQSMYVPTKTVQPASGVWDLKGLELEEYHTFGLNNDVKGGNYYCDYWINNGTRMLGVFKFDAFETKTLNILMYPHKSSVNLFLHVDSGLGWAKNQRITCGEDVLLQRGYFSIPLDANTEYVVINGTKIFPGDETPNIQIANPYFSAKPLTMPNRYDEYSLSIKNKTVKNEIARYTASDWNTLPTFNSEFTYTYDITKLDDGIYEYSIMADSMDNLPTQISFNGKSELLTVEYLNIDNVTNMTFMFYNCINLTSLDVGGWDVGNVTNTCYMFDGCTNLTSLDVGGWDVRNVTDTHHMFANCTNLTSLDVSNWDTSKITDMQSMFQNCSKLTSLDLSNWDISKTASTDCMFDGCTNLTSLDVSKWDTTGVTYMGHTFRNCNKLTSLDLSNWDTSKVTNMNSTFQNCNKLTSITFGSNFNTSKVTSMNSMFLNCNDLTSLDVSNFNTSEVTDMMGVFFGCKKLTSLDVSNFDTSEVTRMESMFDGCINLTSLDSMQNISVSLSLSSTKLDQTSLVDVINNLTTVTTTQTLTLGTTLLAKLTEEQIAVAVNKGWTVA